MKKRAVILHGTDGSPTRLAWQVWLKEQLEANGYEVYFPQLPECHTPNLATYDRFLKDSGWDFADNIVISHSSGATTALHLLQQDWFPHVRATVLVGTFLNERLMDAASWYVKGQFDHLFVDELSVDTIKARSTSFYFVHGDDDPYCDYGEAGQLCKRLGGEFITLHGAGHIGKSANIQSIPSLMKALKDSRVL